MHNVHAAYASVSACVDLNLLITMATGAESSSIKGLFDFFQLCGRLKVRVLHLLSAGRSLCPLLHAAPEEDRLGEPSGAGARDCGWTHVQDGHAQLPLCCGGAGHLPGARGR